MAYLSGWAIESIALFAASHWLSDNSFHLRRAFVVSLLAGAVWPLVTLGLFQYGAIAAVSKIMSDRETAVPPDRSLPDANVASLNPGDRTAAEG